MPLYTYKCDDCNQYTDAFRSVETRNDTPACQCGGATKKVISVYNVVGDLEPYYDDNLESYIKNKRHKQSVMRERGVSEKYGKGWI